VYVPASPATALVIVGFCALEEKPFGPSQVYEVAVPVANK
jgi:hypothetical protein